MGFGIPPSYAMSIELAGSEENACDAMIEVFETLGWTYEQIDPQHLRASIRGTGASWGETFTVSLNNGRAHVKSRCGYPQLFDWGKINAMYSSLPIGCRGAEDEMKQAVCAPSDLTYF